MISALYFSPLVFEELDRLLALHHAAPERRAAGDDLAHLRLDGGEVLRGEGLVAGEIVIEPVLDRRADGDLGAGIERLHGFGEHMRAVVADHLQRFRVAASDEDYRRIAVDLGGEIDQPAVELHRQRSAGETGADRLAPPPCPSPGRRSGARIRRAG